MDNDVVEFLQQSNYIELVMDSDSLERSIIAWKYLQDFGRLTLHRILHAHKIMMKRHLKKEAGKLRTQDVYIGGRKGLPYNILPELMDNWLRIANKSQTEEEIKQDHILFEKIHPFLDGNGRMGRILMNWQRLKAGLPILIIKEEEKWEYYEWFQ